jgi:hypothetical protein
VLSLNQIYGGTRLDHHHDFRRKVIGREYGDGSFDAVVQYSELLLIQSAKKISLTVLNAHADLYNFGGGMDGLLLPSGGTSGCRQLKRAVWE